MALDLYRVSLGLSIEESDGTAAANILSGSGAPGADGDVQDAAPIGSIFLRTDASSSICAVYQKIANGASADDWVQSASKDYVDAAVNGLSWREPALVRDGTTYADITAAQTAANVGDTVDGLTITAGDRLLFTDLTAGNENVYIVSGSSGAWTFTEDTNLATDGDALLIQEGTSADQQWVYDGTNWVQFGGASSAAELGFIRDFIGKDAAGAENPTYSSAVVVTQNGNLEAAIGELDAAIGDRTYTEDNYVTDGQTITASIDALDQAIADAGVIRTTATGVTTQTVIDSVSVDEYQAAKWFVVLFDEGDTDQKQALEVFALNDGTATGDATVVEFNRSSLLRTNGNITGDTVEVVLSGTGAGQVMNLVVTSTDTVTVHATRLDVEI